MPERDEVELISFHTVSKGVVGEVRRVRLQLLACRARPIARKCSPYDYFFLARISLICEQCGRRGGYMELTNIDEAVREQLLKKASISLCPNIQVSRYERSRCLKRFPTLEHAQQHTYIYIYTLTVSLSLLPLSPSINLSVCLSVLLFVALSLSYSHAQGQVMVGLMVDPPKPGDHSHAQYVKETSDIYGAQGTLCLLFVCLFLRVSEPLRIFLRGSLLT
jgi:hypothetical protein